MNTIRLTGPDHPITVNPDMICAMERVSDEQTLITFGHNHYCYVLETPEQIEQMVNRKPSQDIPSKPLYVKSEGTYCRRCGKELISQENFCPECGIDLEQSDHPVWGNK